MRGREHETDARFADAARDLVRRQIDPDAECGQHIGRARARGQRTIAMLGDRNAGAGDDKRGARRDIERARSVAAGADDIDGIGRRAHAQHFRAHGRDRAGDLLDRLAAHAQRHEEAAHLRGSSFARHHLLEGAGRLLAR
jgi:hypothetical protein